MSLCENETPSSARSGSSASFAVAGSANRSTNAPSGSTRARDDDAIGGRDPDASSPPRFASSEEDALFFFFAFLFLRMNAPIAEAPATTKAAGCTIVAPGDCCRAVSSATMLKRRSVSSASLHLRSRFRTKRGRSHLRVQS
eukprot:30850-Pelagococcus_subviridis.AAC.31